MSTELSKSDNFMLEPSRFEQIQNIAKFLSGSDLVPSHFQGKPANVFIALNYAARMNLDPFMVMSSMFVVHGRPGWEGKFLIALVNNSGLFDEPLEFVFEGEGDDYGCFARARKGRKHIDGPKVTRAMVKAEKWDRPKDVKDKQGKVLYTIPSKWSTMAELMFRYRAGAYFVNTVCPEVKLGLPTREEIEDIGPQILMEDQDGTYRPQEPQEDPEVISTFWTLVDGAAECPGMEGDKLFNQFLNETVRAMGKSSYDTKKEALGDFEGFWGCWQRWLDKNVDPGKTTSPDAPGETISAPPNQNHAPGPDPQAAGGDAQNSGQTKGPTQAQITILKKEVDRVNLDEAAVCKKMGVSSYGALNPEEYSEALLWLKNIKT